MKAGILSMNKLNGFIKEVTVSPYMALIQVEHMGDFFTAAIQETPVGAARFKKDIEVTLIFKETEVLLAKGLSGKISLRNRAFAFVKSIETAGVLTRVTLDYKGQRIASVITTPGVIYLDIKVGDEIEWLIKANEVSLIGV